MTNITETAEWSPNVMLLDITTPVLGGLEGPSNTPLKQLANRTAYLKGEVEKKALLLHNHGIGNVTGLQAILDGKAPAAHTHAQGDITGLAAALAGKSDASHVHAIAGVTGLQAALDGKSATSHTHTPVSLGAAAAAHGHAVSDITNLQTLLDGKATSAHSHITGNITGLDVALAGKAPLSHTHTTGNVTGLDTALAGKAPISHTHGAGEVAGLPYDIYGTTGKGVIGQLLIANLPITRSVRIPKNLAESKAVSSTDIVEQMNVFVYLYRANGSSSLIGEWYFAPGTATPTLSSSPSDDVVCGPGDRLTIVASPYPPATGSLRPGCGVLIKASLA